ncbi:Plastid-lipid-associated protein 14 precursor [Actinidia chinensis var. chinensis]|uniref:Plastid-lipid-associated protein 14 n=1 Tax=Actinidia chinensis var. chinensis TaxID=1590841 RepID=A0A2R6RSM6_ACTCC|nr:Plastid-lipid-associated protein 14 precursor [Actinidia chinensis var. chinensis]
MSLLIWCVQIPMALCGIGWCPTWDGVEVPILSSNLSTRRVIPFMGKTDSPRQIRCSRIRCSVSIKNATSLGSEEVADDTSSDSLGEELGHVKKFKMSDFKICDWVSIGLSGRTDERVFEALVKDVHR